MIQLRNLPGNFQSGKGPRLLQNAGNHHEIRLRQPDHVGPVQTSRPSQRDAVILSEIPSDPRGADPHIGRLHRRPEIGGGGPLLQYSGAGGGIQPQAAVFRPGRLRNLHIPGNSIRSFQIAGCQHRPFPPKAGFQTAVIPFVHGAGIFLIRKDNDIRPHVYKLLGPFRVKSQINPALSQHQFPALGIVQGVPRPNGRNIFWTQKLFGGTWCQNGIKIRAEVLHLREFPLPDSGAAVQAAEGVHRLPAGPEPLQHGHFHVHASFYRYRRLFPGWGMVRQHQAKNSRHRALNRLMALLYRVKS